MCNQKVSAKNFVCPARLFLIFCNTFKLGILHKRIVVIAIKVTPLSLFYSENYIIYISEFTTNILLS